MDQTKIFKLAHFENRLNDIWKKYFLISKQIEEFDSIAEKNDKTNGASVPESGSWAKFKKGDRWVDHNNYLWLKTTLSIPKEWGKNKVAFSLRALCYNIDSVIELNVFGTPPIYEPKWLGFEGMLFLNGEPYHGVDNNHQLIFLPDNVIGNDIEITIRVWSGTDPASKERRFAIELDNSFVGAIDNNAIEFYMLGLSILNTINELPEQDQYHPDLYNALDEAIKIIDFTDMDSDTFRNSLAKAFEFLNNKFNDISKNKYHVANDYAVGHTHLDVAWLWQLHQLIEKSARSWLTVLRWMDLDPTYTFLQTQPQLYADVKKYYPSMYEQIKKRVKEGRWSVEGSMWVEADCNISSGEALSRQILYGKRFFKEEFDVETKTLWLPDVFGYSYALPQILQLTEVETFITSKISWNQYNRFPHDLFIWRGMGGFDILTTFIVTPDPKPRNNWYYTYNGEMTAEIVKDAWEAFSEKDICKSFIHPYGYGDGGSGTTFKQLKMKNYLKKMPGIPNIKDATLGEFNTDLHKEMDPKKDITPIFSGELYLEFHRGTYTSQALVKKNNRKFELSLAHLENLFVWDFINNKKTCDKDLLRSYWHTVLKNQFHDILPGSSTHDVYEDSRIEFEKLGEEIDGHKKTISNAVFKNDDKSITLFNPLAHERNDVLKIKDDKIKALADSKGNHLKSQKVEDEIWFENIHATQMGFTTLKKHDGKIEEKSTSEIFNVSKNSIKTKEITLKWNDIGQITSLVLNKNGFEFVAKDKAMNIFEMLEDKPRQYDAWEFEPYAEEKTDIVNDFIGSEVISIGDVALVIRFKWKYHKSTIEQDMILYTNSMKIDFDTKINWNERDKLLRTAFHANVITNKATYDIQYGNVERPTHRNTSWDVARFEVAAHKWADIGDRGYGISVLNECKYGYSALHNCLRITLLKSPQMPDPTADAGYHRFTYSLLPHEGTWIEADTNKIALELNSPYQIFDGKSIDNDISIVCIEGDKSYIEIDTLKLAEDSDDIILRLHEYAGVHSKINIKTCFDVKSWQKVNILERPMEKENSGAINIEVAPYEIVTLKLSI